MNFFFFLHQIKISNISKKKKDLAKRFKVGSYPTLFFMKNGYYYAYTGGRTVEDFKAFIETGFKTAVKTKVPQPPTEWDKILEQVEVTMSDFEVSFLLLLFFIKKKLFLISCQKRK